MLTAILAVASASCGGGDGNARFVYEVDKGVSDTDAGLVKREMEAARSYFEHTLGVELQLDWKVKLVPSSLFYVGTVGSSVTFQMGSGFWDGAELRAIQELIAHELFHVFQADLNGSFSLGPKAGPSWLLEGSAEYAALHYVSFRNKVGFDDILALVRLTYDGATLYNYSVVDKSGYAAAFLAVHELVGSDGLDVLRAYFQDLSDTVWTEAFQRRFGVDADTFIRNFSEG